MRNLVQPPPSLHCDHCNGELRLKLIEPANSVFDLDARYSSAQSAAMSSRTWCSTTTIPHRLELAADQLFDEPPSQSLQYEAAPYLKSQYGTRDAWRVGAIQIVGLSDARSRQ